MGPVNFFCDASDPLIAAFCFCHSRTLLSSTPKIAAALQFPLSCAHQITSHSLSSCGISVLPDRVAAIKAYPRPTNLRALRRFVGMTGFYAQFIPDYCCMRPRGKGQNLYGLRGFRLRFIPLSRPCRRPQCFKFPILTNSLYWLRMLVTWRSRLF